MLLSCGSNSHNRLGFESDSLTPSSPVGISPFGIRCIASGWRHNVIIYNDGTAIGWGDNSDFQIGHQNQNNDPRVIAYFKNNGIHLLWAACGDKHTIFLTIDGNVYICDSACKDRKPRKINIGENCIFVNSNSSSCFAIGRSGCVYEIGKSCCNNVIKNTLPEPAYDVAGTNSFVLAVGISGKVYGKGKVFGGKEFVPLKGFENIKVSRVFGYSDHSAILTEGGLVYSQGKVENGSSELDKLEFILVDKLKGVKVTCIGMGDAHTIFITEDGSLYGCGISDNGRIFCGETNNIPFPKKSPYIKGKAVYVSCGCFHSIALIDAPKIIHPGMLAMGLLDNYKTSDNLVWGDISLDLSVRTSFNYNYLPGDLVLYKNTEFCIFIGVSLDSSFVVLFDNGEIKKVQQMSIKFVSRNKYIGARVTITDKKEEVDCGRILNLIGLITGEILTSNNETKEKFEVYGLYKNSLVLMNETNDLSLVELSIPKIFESYTLTSTKRNIKNITIDGISYPVQLINEPFYNNENKPITIIGKIGKFFIGKNIFNEYSFCFQDVIPIQSNNGFYLYDNVIYDFNKKGKIVSFINDSAVIYSEEFGNITKIIPIEQLELISRIVPFGKRTINNIEYNVSISDCKTTNCLPNDLFVGKSGFASIIGYIGDKAYAEINNEIVEFNPQEFKLLRRNYDIEAECFNYSLMNNSITSFSANVLSSSMSECDFLQGDGILFDGHNGVICSLTDDYINFIFINDDEEKEISSIHISDPKISKLFTLVSRPSTDLSFFV